MTHLHFSAGLRCRTRTEMTTRYNIKQPSLPFDSGFFPCDSIINFLKAPELNISVNNTSPCIKYEQTRDQKTNLMGTRFVKTSYDAIDEYITNNGYSNKYLDYTKGYYTSLDDYGIVLAHYNWHPSSEEHITNPEENVDIMNKLLNRRRDRLFELIDQADIMSIYYFRNAAFMEIDDNRFELDEDSVRLKLLNYFKDKQVNFIRIPGSGLF